VEQPCRSGWTGKSLTLTLTLTLRGSPLEEILTQPSVKRRQSREKDIAAPVDDRRPFAKDLETPVEDRDAPVDDQKLFAKDLEAPVDD
jgi:hypothetical protein